MVAGQGARTMQLAARYANAWTTAWYHRPDEVLRARLEAMARTLDQHSRDPMTLRRMVGVRAVDPTHQPVGPDELSMVGGDLSAAIDGYRRLGIDELIIGLQPVTERSIDYLIDAMAP